jgi:hypothetical protein
MWTKIAAIWIFQNFCLVMGLIGNFLAKFKLKVATQLIVADFKNVAIKRNYFSLA